MNRALTAMSLLAVLGLAGCGNPRALQPARGEHLPVAPYGRVSPRSADQLLKPPVEAKPERNVELRTKSEPREDDPFDLPPPG